MVLKRGREAAARAVFEKWELDFAIVGEITDTGRVVLTAGGEVVADMPIAPLVEQAPQYDRPWTPPAAVAPLDAIEAPESLTASLERLVASPDLCSKRWVWEQYDHMVMADTVQRPGGDAAVVRVHGSNKALALTIDCTPRYCAADPRRGGAQAVAEAWRNLTATGARPLAITDCLNFGNPERADVMGQFVGCVEGMAEACRALEFPVVSGNVSFYNETSSHAIQPTPAVGAVGLIDDLDRMATPALKAEGETLIVIGETRGHLGASLYARDIVGREAGAPPPVDLEAEHRNGDFLRGLIETGRVSACHDIADGGLLVAVAEMALAGGVGATLEVPDDAPSRPAWAFGEDQARYVVSADAARVDEILRLAKTAGVPATVIGRTGGAALTVSGDNPISLKALRDAHEAWMPAYMAAR